MHGEDRDNAEETEGIRRFSGTGKPVPPAGRIHPATALSVLRRAFAVRGAFHAADSAFFSRFVGEGLEA